MMAIRATTNTVTHSAIDLATIGTVNARMQKAVAAWPRVMAHIYNLCRTTNRK